jgi:glycosyltransferase involved in cell wall biosynthesis
MVLEGSFPDIRVEKEINALFEAGYRIILVCSALERHRKDGIEQKISIYTKPIPKWVQKLSLASLKLPFYFNFWRGFLKEVFKQEKIDAIHIHDLPLAKVGYEIKRRYNTLLVLDFHENWPAHLSESAFTKTIAGKIFFSRKQWDKYEVKMAHKADAIVAVIGKMKEYLINKGILGNKIFVVPNTVDTKKLEFEEIGSDSNYITLFYSGGLTIHRGLQIVIKSMSDLIKQYPHLRLWIAGKGSYQNTLKNLIKKLGIESYVKFFGLLPYDKMADLLFKSDIALIPHKKTLQRDTTIPNKLFEYMYAAKPILSSNVESVEKIIGETKCGLIYKHDSTKDFKDKLEYLIKNPNEMEKMGKNGKNNVKLKYNWKNSSIVLIKLYQNLTSN